MQALVSIPATATPGQIVDIKVLISHPMETGFRPRIDGSMVPRDIITRLVCRYDGETVLEIDLNPAIAANPFFAFPLRVDRSGEVELEWTDWQGTLHRQSGRIEVA
jgi:sulfur-oxidizing protein SoxZ